MRLDRIGKKPCPSYWFGYGYLPSGLHREINSFPLLLHMFSFTGLDDAPPYPLTPCVG